MALGLLRQLGAGDSLAGAATAAADSAAVATGPAVAKKILLLVWTFFASVVAVEPGLGRFFFFLTIVDFGTVWLNGGQRVWRSPDFAGKTRRAAVWSQTKGASVRLLQNAVILAVTLSFAQAFPLFGLISDAGVAWTAGVAGLGAFDHVLPPRHGFRLFFVRAWQKALSGLGFADDAATGASADIPSPPPSDDDSK